jgi:hypothetical protein
MKQDEKKLHKAVCKYIKLKYPDLIFTSDQSGLKVSIGVAKQLKDTRHPERGIPDLIILEPRNQYAGLCLEFKASVDDLYLKSGNYKNTAHIKEQREVLERLRRKGYAASFAVGFDHAVSLIEDYMGNTYAE